MYKTKKYLSSHIILEHCDGRSVTVPDQSMSLREIMQRSLSGVSPEVFNNDNYDATIDDFDERRRNGEDIFDDPTREPGFDFVDAFQLEKKLSKKEKEYTEARERVKLQKAEEAKQQAKADAEELAALRAAQKNAD